MKRFLTLWAVVCAAANVAFAVAVTPEQAKAVANVWVRENASFGAGGAAKSVFAVCDTNAAKTVLWYQVSMTGGSALMVAPVTEIEPVVAALEVDPGELPAAHPLRGILMGDMRRRLKFLGLYANDGVVARGTGAVSGSTVVRGTGVAKPVDDTAAKVAAEWGAKQASKWDRLTAKATARVSDSVGVADPIATEISVVKGFEKGGYLTHWNQGSWAGDYCYNLYTPNHAVCGCVATAAAAMMQFFQVEAVAPYESSSCTYQGKKYETVFGEKAKTMQSEDDPKIYDWSLFEGCETVEQIKEKLQDPENGEAARDVIGRLAYDAGVCLGMMWDMPDGSGSGAVTANIASILTKQFQFKAARSLSPKQEQYAKLIYAQIRAGAPVGMGIDGHAVVACGFGLDGDGVSRVRVFMGWGGSGDAWYALPYIDTTAVLGGDSYLSEVVNTVITMVNKDDDKVIPVVGQVIPALDADVTCAGVTAKANTLGYFGLRVSPEDAGDLEISCQGKTYGVTVGSITDKSSAADVCAATPDPITLLLLNSQAATTPMDAKAKALAAGKPMLFFSGASGDAVCDAAWQLINDLDDQNIDDFTNKFVIAYFAWDPSATSYSDGKPSYGVFDPTVYDESAPNRWAFFNGRLAYDNFARCTTNITEDATNYVATAETRDAVMRVLNEGYSEYLRRHSGITMEIVSDPAITTVGGSFANAFTNGEEVVFAAPLAVTNESAGVVYVCTNWTAKAVSADGTESPAGSGTNGLVSLTVSSNTAYTVTLSWAISEVRVTCAVRATDGIPRGKVTQEGGTETNVQVVAWVKVPETEEDLNEVRFVAIPEPGYVVGPWYGTGWAEGATNTVSIGASTTDQLSISVSFVASGRSQLTVKELPKLASGTFASSFTPLDIYGRSITIGGRGGYLDHGALVAAVTPSNKVIDGVTWVCGAWQLLKGADVVDSGEGATAQFAFDGNATLAWQWGVDVATTLAAKGWDGTSSPTAATLSLGALPAGVSAADVVFFNVPAGWQATPSVTASGTLSVTLAPGMNWASENLGVDLTVNTVPDDLRTATDPEIAYVITAGSATALTIAAPAAYTNETTGWIWSPVSWAVSGDQTANGEGATASFAVAAGNVLTLDWTWQKVGVRLAAKFEYPAVVPAFHEKSAMDSYEEWRLFGESATFTITNVWNGTSMPEALQYWKSDSTAWTPNGLSATVTASETDGPVVLVAVMGAGTYYQKGLGAIVVTSEVVRVSGEVTTRERCAYGAASLASIEAVSAPSWDTPCVLEMLEPICVVTQGVNVVTNTCVGWELQSAADSTVVYAQGSGCTAQFTRVSDACTFVWLWEPSAASEPEPGPGPEPEPEYAQPTPIAFTTIQSTATGFALTITNAVKYCSYKLYAAATPGGFDLTQEPVKSVVAEADGPLVFEVSASSAGLFWKVVAEPGLIPSDE